MKKERGASGKKVRYEQATEKYKLFQQKKDRINQMDGILTGKQNEVVVPKPGEFFVVSSDSVPNLNRKLISQAIRDQQDPTPKSRLASAKGMGGGGLTSAKSHSQFNHGGRILKPSLTDRKKKKSKPDSVNRMAAGKQAASITIDPTERMDGGGLTMSSLQGEISKQMSLPTFKNAGQRATTNLKSHDFPPGLLSARAGQNAGGFDGDISNNPTGLRQYEQSNAESNQLHAEQNAAAMNSYDQGVQQKQYQVLQNPQMRTSLTTNIRNIMRNQDRGLLTTSTRLLNAQVKKAELKLDIQRDEGSPNQDSQQAMHMSARNLGQQNDSKKAISTIDLLRQQKEMVKKLRHISQDGGTLNREYDDVITHDMSESGQQQDAQLQQLTNAVSMPVLPTVGFGVGQSSIDIVSRAGANQTVQGNLVTQTATDVQMFSQRDPFVARLSNKGGSTAMVTHRPSSTILMQMGEKDTKKMVKKKFDLQNARQRDPTKPQSHSYKAKVISAITTSQKWKDQHSILPPNQQKPQAGVVPKMPATPVIVQYQNALVRENKQVSPFMFNGPSLDPAQAQIEVPKTKKQIEMEQQRMQHSQSVKTMHTPGQPLQEEMKYSESLNTLSKLRDIDEDSKNRPSSSVFKKGTSDFIKRKIEASNQGGKHDYETGQFQKAIEKRFGTEIQGDSRDRTFLPVEAFDPLLDIEVPEDVIEHYRDPATGQTIGLSKWNFPSGKAELRECFVDGFIKNQDLYEISWCHNREIKKKVSRFNLIFKLEDNEDYERRIFMAHKFRSEAEILMRYHYMIENTKIPKARTGGGGKKTQVPLPELLDQTKTRISYMISTFQPWRHNVEHRNYKDVQGFFAKDFNQRYRFIKFYQRWKDFNATVPDQLVRQIHSDMNERHFDLQLLQNLFQELDMDFQRAHKQIYFDIQLPYDKEKFVMFNSVLPKDKFIPVPEKEADQVSPPALIEIAERESNFEKRLEKMAVKLHQGNLPKMRVLQMCHRQKQQNLQKRLIQLQFTEPCKLDFMRKEHSIALGNFVTDLQNHKFDCEYDTQAIINEEQLKIDQLNIEAKQSMTHHAEQYVEVEISEEFMRTMVNFQRVIAIQFENTMREVFISSVEECKEQIKFAIDQVVMSTGKPHALSQESEEAAPEAQEESVLNKNDILKMSRDAVMQTRFREKQCFQFDITLKYDKDKKMIKASPHAEDWINALPQHFESALNNLTTVKCFLHERLGQIHASNIGHVLFQTDADCREDYPEIEVENITQLLQQLFKVLESLLKSSNEYSYILEEEMKDFKRKQKSDSITVEEYSSVLEDYKRKRDEIDELFFEDALYIGPIVVRVGDLKQRLKDKISRLNEVLLQQIKKKVDGSKQQIHDEVDNVLKIIRKTNYKNIEEVTETKKFIKNLQDKRLEIDRLIAGVTGKVQVLDNNFFQLTEQENISIWEAFARPMEITEEQGDCVQLLEDLSNTFQGDLRIMQSRLIQEIQDIQQEFESIQEYEELSQNLEAGRRTEMLEERIQETMHEAKICNHREMLFGQAETDFSGIKIIKEKFEPFNKLWQLATQYYNRIQNWMNGEVAELDGEALPKEVDEAIQALKYLKTKHFKEYPFTAQICQELRDLYMQLKPFMPVLNSLKNPDFKVVHFEILKKDYNIVIETTLSQSLSQLKEIGVMDIVDEIIEISAIATKERQLESQLNKMNDEWKTVRFDLTPYRDSEVHILQGVQSIWDLLDEHIQKTMLIASSPYAKFFLSEALYWKSRLVKVQEILEEWSRVQRGWCYLWPIFNSPDIQQQLPEVYLTFSSMDKLWRIVMSQTQGNPIVLDACNQHRAYENLVYCNDTIENVKKKLNEYLHSKQLLFPRFFFLSNDDLLHILSQTKDPVRVQDHLNKCFEGIQLLNFTKEKLIVTSMISAMDEEVQFNQTIDPFIIKKVRETIDENDQDAPSGKRHRTRVVEHTVKEVRAIEDWLSEVEFQMRDSLRKNIVDSTEEFHRSQKSAWIFAWPQQIVLAIDQIEWTSKMERSIQSTAENSLTKAFALEEEKVAELVDLIRTPNLSKADMRTLESLIVTDVHSRDTTAEIMQLNVRDIASFEWISQLRHYTAMEDNARIKSEPKLEIKISMINSTRNYGFEYQGSQTRLVITPLTDRCYRTLMGALQLNLGGAPEGPAGTGKTETTKDLAKALAKQCLVFNCSDQIDVATMGKFFKGLACCGAWACFDEFNRIELEVLSVIAQQILTIQASLMRMKKATTTFIFEEESITLDAQCAVFITMNPTYAGRSQLPDNLKALFRPVAMMIPNYETIAEIQLYSYGFQTARQLSVKIVQSLKLSSEQLSTQSHYDYGMRAVKSIILASGALRKEWPDQNEDITVLRAISVCNIPKFIKEDIDQFNGIISDLFPTTDNSPQEYNQLKHQIGQSIEAKNLEPNQEFETKIMQLYETVQVRHGLMLVGAPMGGKSTICATLADALTRIEMQKAKDAVLEQQSERSHMLSNDETANDNSLVNEAKLKAPKVQIHSINPKSVTIGKLYGDYEKVGDWMDGILAITVRDAASDKTGDTHWIMLDGPVDTLWIENLNTVLDDNKKLCLISGEIIKLTEQMTMMFEVEDLQEASPATVSRCGMVYVTPEKLGWEPLLSEWISSIPNGMKENGMQAIYKDLITAFVPGIMQFLFGKEQSQEEDLRLESLKPVLSVSKNWLFRSFLNLFESLLLDSETKESYLEKENEAREKEEINKKKQAMTLLRAGTLDLENEKKNAARKANQKVQKWYDTMDPREINKIIQKFIMALIWGFGSSLTSPARPKYSLFLHEMLDKVFATATCEFEFKKRIDMQIFPKNNTNLFSIFFHTGEHCWHKWDYEIGKYDILGDKEKVVEVKIEQPKEDDDSQKGGDSPLSGGGAFQFDEEFQDKVEFQNIMVATEDSIQQQFIMDVVVSHQFPMLIVGDTGTGKTRGIKKLVSQLLARISNEGKYGWESGEMVLSATSTPQQIQQYTESKLEKHKKGVYGPKNPNNHLLIFMDDLNMPVKEKFGAQPSLEMMRQIMDSNGFYNEKTLEFSKIVRQIFLCAMGTPGGGRSLPSMRLLRHFNLFNFPNMSKETMTRIYKTILEWGFEAYTPSWQKQIVTMTELTIETYQKCVETLLPLPRKAHYLFNMRQVSEIIQGLFSVPPEVIETKKEKLTSLKRLWLHEVMRVFSDRLIDEDDKALFARECLSQEGSNFFKPDDLQNAPSLIFCNFVEPDSDSPIYMESLSNDYLRTSLGKVVEFYNASRTGGREKMSVLLFDYLLQHLARVSRILAKPFGNGLLIGLGGNGRKTIAKLATFINDCQSFKIALHKNYSTLEWLDDLRNLYKTLGIDNKKIVFSFSDKEIKEEKFIEDINNILNVGELTSLFAAEDEEEIHYEIEKQLRKAKVKDTSQEATHAFFAKRCKRNLHMLLFMSPAGTQLQNYFRKYPSLVNCTSIDWFLSWPASALKAVSEHYLIKLSGVIQDATQAISPFNERTPLNNRSPKGESHSLTTPKEEGSAAMTQQAKPLETIAEGFEDRDDGSLGMNTAEKKAPKVPTSFSGPLPSEPDIAIDALDAQQMVMEELLDPEAQAIAKMPIRERVSQIFTQIHQTAMDLSERYFKETKRQVYVTPVMFMGVFEVFEQLLSRKNEEIERERSKYDQGVKKLEEAKIMIEEMEEYLINLQPTLVAKEKQVNKTARLLEVESREVFAVKEVVDAETEEAEAEKRVAEGIREECQQKLNIAQPYFDRAIKALRTLSNNDFVLMKSFQNPPKGVRLALEGCCIMLNIAPTMKKVDGVKRADYWDKSKKLINNYKKLLDQLENYPKENIEPAVLAKIQPYLENPDYQPDIIRGASEAAEGLCKWVYAIIKFNEIYREITPKRHALAEAEGKCKVTEEKLQVKLEKLKKLQDQLAELQAEEQKLKAEKKELNDKKIEATNKLERANALMTSIGSEKDRWIITKQKLAEDKLSLLGDMIIATCFVNYLGPYEGSYRIKILTESWQKLNTKYQIKQTYDYTLKEILGDVEKISDWTLRGLPNESMSYENMIIIDETIQKKYPIMIDPEGQAFRYMRDNVGVASEMTSSNSRELMRITVKTSSPNLVKQLTNALQQGSLVFCENSGEVTHPALLSILRRDLSTIQGDLYINFNDQNIEFDTDFKIYMFSQLSNPHFSPEVQQLGKILNFSVTREGLEQQLLQIICRNELQREEEDRERYAKQTLLLGKKKREVFDQILTTLRNSGQEILESDSFVKTLNESKETTNEIEKKLKQAKNNEDKIREQREKFQVTAKQGARLYFAVQDLKLLDEMYQFSMNWFRGLFNQTFSFEEPVSEADEEQKSQLDGSDSDFMAIQNHRRTTTRVPNQQDMTKKQKLELMEKRAKILKDQFREILYRNVCMSLFEHHKLLFAFFISLKVYEKDKSFQEGLDRLQQLPVPKGGDKFDRSKMDQSKMDNSSRISDNKSDAQQPKAAQQQSQAKSIAQTRTSMPRKSIGRAGALQSRKDHSDAMTALDEERELQQKEEERKLVIDESLLKYLLTGLMMADAEPYSFVEITRPDLFTETMWAELHQLTSFSCYETLIENIIKDINSWERFMRCEKADAAFEYFPEPYQSQLPYFAWIPLIRCLKPELTTLTIRRYVAKSLGRYFVTPIIFNLREVYEGSFVHTPLLLILTPGNDPMDQIRKLSEEKQRRVVPVSLGKGQGEKAKSMISEFRKTSTWIVLQNCHLSKSFLPDLEQIVESLQPQTGQINSGSSIAQLDDGEKKEPTNADFRIWLTSMSVNYFPQMLLHQSLKITSEPPKGIKSSMIRSYASVISSKSELAFYNESKKFEIWQKLFLSLSFFHAIVRERRRFGPLGWTAQYDFNDSDFRVSMKQLYSMVDSFENVPFKALRYLTGLCNYGGRVTDDRDRRALATILDDFYNDKVIGNDNYFIVDERFKKYFIFQGETAKDYLDYCKHLPDEESPQLMGLHDNAIIQQAMTEANTIFQNTLKLTESSSSNDGGSGEESNRMVKKMTEDILAGIREPFKIKEIERNYPFKYEESMNSVLLQELARYNTLIETILESLNIMLKTLEGKLVSNSDTDELLTSIKNNSIPEKWLKKSYPSRKSLLGYIDDLKKRLAVFEEWIQNGKPHCFWISGFFFTQSFLTGVKQNFARKHHYPIDKVDFAYTVLKHSDDSMAKTTSPEDGCYLNGFFLEGAAWDDQNGVLRESDPKVIHVPLPVMHFIPKYLLAENQKDNSAQPGQEEQQNSENMSRDEGYSYECPAYKTSERAGQLLTTGHNTNYIQMINLASGEEPSKWIRRGVALLCQLDN